MAVKGLDIFKLSPKKNCKECGSPTCMAFCMKVAQGAVPITKCPYMSEEAVALLSEATAPPMKTIEVGTHKLGGETVMMRHEKTLVNRNLFAATLATDMDDAAIDARIDRSVIHVCSKGSGKQVAVDQGLLMTHHDGLTAELMRADLDGLHGRRGSLRQKGNSLFGHVRALRDGNSALGDLHAECHAGGAAAFLTVFLRR